MPILKPTTKRLGDGEKTTTTVVLHGHLSRYSDGPLTLRVRNAHSAVRALCHLKPGFERAFSEGNYRLIRGDFERGLDLDEKMLDIRTAGTTLHFLPMGSGAKNGAGIGKVVVGAVIVVASIFTYGAAAGWFGAYGSAYAGAVGATASGISIAGATVGYGSIALFGASILLSGISSLLSPQQKKNTGLSTNSFGLSGRVNTTTEGGPIPVVYGQTMVGSTVISAGYSAEDLLTIVPYNNGDQGQGGSSGSADYTESVDSGGGTGGGGGGKGGGGTGSSTEMNNTLQSDAIVRVIDLLGEGQVNLVNGAQSIYFNGTPLQTEQGTYNFQGVNWEVRTGLPDQDPVSGYPSAEDTFTPEVQITQANGPFVQNVTSETANRLSVTMQIQSLFSVDATTGFVGAGPDLSYMIEIQQVEGPWTTAVTQTFSGQKTDAPYQKTYSINLPNAGNGATSWNFRITRLTADNAYDNIGDDTYLYAYGLITDQQMIYPNSAYVALTIDAESFGSSIPTREYIVERLDVQVPLNFDAATGTYATSGPGTSGGTWDGVSWQTAVTSDPCWCLLDLLQNSRFGLALPADVVESTAYDLYTISQYCNQLVPDGFGGMEPRYTLNVVMATQADAYQVIQNMVSVFRGMTYWGSGQVVISADMPAEPVSLVTQANVVDGNFNYEGTGLNTRHNMVRVTWIDPGNLYQQAVEVVENIPNIALRGVVPTDIVAFGCQSRGLAHRLGKWLLYSEQYQTDTLTFSCGYDQINVRPGMIFAQVDPSYAGVRLGGRIRPGATTTVVPLDAVVPSTGVTDFYYLSCQLPDGTLASNIQISELNTLTDENGVQYSQAVLVGPMDEVPDADAVYIIQSTSITPRLWQCIGMTEPSPGVYQIVGVSYDPSKYGYIEDGLALTNNNFSTLPALLTAPVPPPTNVTARSFLVTVGTGTVIRVMVSWTAADDPRVVSYQIRSIGSNGAVTGLYTSAGVTCDIDNLPIGSYIFSVCSLGRDGRTSIWVSAPTLYVNGVSGAPDAPTGLTAIGGTRRIQLNWNPPPQPDILNYEIWRGGNPLLPPGLGATLLLAISATSYTDNDSANLLPNTTWSYWVRAISTTSQDGAFAGPVTAETTDLVADSLADGIVGTASFAQGLTPVTLIPNITYQPGSFDQQIAYDENTKALYQWSASAGQWVGVLNAINSAWFNSITAGIASFGGLNAAQIAAGAIHAEQLASETLLTESAQIGNEVVTNAQIANLTIGSQNVNYNEITETYYSEVDTLGVGPNGSEVNSLGLVVPDSETAVMLFMRVAFGISTTTPTTDPETGGEGP